MMRLALFATCGLILVLPGCGADGNTKDPLETKPSLSQAYRDARDLCGLYTPTQIAKEYGSSTDPDDAAWALAEASYSVESQMDAYHGCRDGLASQ